MPNLIPKEALAFLRNKKLRTGFSYKDVWHEEHAAAFTVAKAMQMDVLSDLHTAVVNAMEQGQSFEGFKKNIKPILEQKGWWGKKQMLDEHTDNMVNAQLGSDRRLKTIYRVNMRSAYQKGQYDRTMASSLHPYLMYRLGNSRRHREEHLAWEGLILPKDDPWWNSHFPPNGWGCNCYTVAVSEARKKRYEEEGIPTAPRADGSGGGNVPAQTVAPPPKTEIYYNERKGTLEHVPLGVHPAFNWHQGKAGRSETGLVDKLAESRRRLLEVTAALPHIPAFPAPTGTVTPAVIATNLRRAQREAQRLYPNHAWMPHGDRIFLSRRRAIGAKTNFADELRDAQILRDRGAHCLPCTRGAFSSRQEV
jgi:SPP1 gp7 family putative phage head morphogenesis protein